MESTRPFVAGRGVKTDGSDTDASSPCIVLNGLVTGYKDTVFLTSVQGQSDAQIFAAWFFCSFLRRNLKE
jgi:hypothetical protein